YRRLRKYQMPEHEWDLWHLDQKINNRGIPISLPTVKAAMRIMNRTVRRDLAEMKALTGLQNPNSNPQLLPWLRAHGYVYTDLKKGHIERAALALIADLEEQGPLGEPFPEPLRTYLNERDPREKLLKVL